MPPFAAYGYDHRPSRFLADGAFGDAEGESAVIWHASGGKRSTNSVGSSWQVVSISG